MGRNRIAVRVGGSLLIFLALSVLVLPLQWVIAFVLAAAIHEAGHYLSIRCCGGQVHGFSIGAEGAKLEVTGLTPGRELICTLAGPGAGLLLLFFARWLPRTALCGALHAVFNLLPVYPMDGGRAIQCLTELLLPEAVGAKVCDFIQFICLAGIGILGLYGTFVLRLGLLPLILAMLLLQRAVSGKIPCKPGLL